MKDRSSVNMERKYTGYIAKKNSKSGMAIT